MREFLDSQNYLLKRDSAFRFVLFISILAGLGFTVYVGTRNQFRISYALEPLDIVLTVSLVMYLFFSLFVCFFATEGFESRSILNVLAAGHSRTTYVLGKLLVAVKGIFACYAVFLGLFTLLSTLVSVLLGHYDLSIGNPQNLLMLQKILLHLLYLTVYATIVLSVGIVVRNRSVTIIVAFGLLMGDLYLYGYLQDAGSPVLEGISRHTLTSQIATFSGLAMGNKAIPVGEFAFLAPIIGKAVLVIAVFLSLAVITFQYRDVR